MFTELQQKITNEEIRQTTYKIFERTSFIHKAQINEVFVRKDGCF